MSSTFDDRSLAAIPADAAPPLVKIAALLATGYAVHWSLSPPNPPPAPKTCVDNRTLFERAIRHVTFCTKMMTWAFVLADALVTLHLAFPSPLTSLFAAALLPAGTGAFPDALASSLSTSSLSSTATTTSTPMVGALLTPSWLLLLGSVVVSCGAVLRLACFRALGSLFTFEITISPDHTLVTAGPYSHVRHPSYTGVYALLLGSTAVMLAPGAWLREAWLVPSACAAVRGLAGMVEDLGLERREDVGAGEGSCLGRPGAVGAILAWAFVIFWTTKVTYALKSTNKRVQTEDRELHRVFGSQWEEWADRVRWRLVPWVY
ncbi:hypothetical protein GSI_10317 [Ganoderma sinense ZZ0214-1]|uniref:Protein-S-isoprenylcysteine O-methyltransferase n=1 Tax=Ganoderma sinense ZZ0214-1 TaxID=1077348 RepID=A0A2G8S0A0_9APHY|nr:hypothetical protein GSI_10317 [Ganoderma sinense ZZ0214-1]